MADKDLRYILHIDMDAFFASIEQRDNPDFRGKPVLVGGSSRERGVVSAASYEARPFGCHSAMPMATAIKLCPQAVVVPVRMNRYSEVSHQVFSIFEQFTPQIEPVSIDEAFLDVTGCQKLLGSPEKIAADIKARVRKETQLTCSVGLAPNKFLAKLASDLRKPDGLVVVDPSEVEEFLNPLSVSRMWGVGKATLPRLEALGIRTFADIRKLSLADLQRRFGAMGEAFYEFARGIDHRPVEVEGETKSISSETTFPVDISIRQKDALRSVLLDQTENVARRLRRHGLLARTVTLKLRSPDFTTLSRSATLQTATDRTDELWQAICELFETWARQKPFSVRLIGMGVSSLLPPGGQQLMLFDADQTQRQGRIDEAMDKIRDKFGPDAIGRGKLKHDP